MIILWKRLAGEMAGGSGRPPDKNWKKLSIERNFTGRKRAHAEFFLVGVPHDSINFPGDRGCVIGFSALFADIRRYIFDNNDLPGSVRQKLSLSFAEFSLAETAVIRNHGSSFLLRYSIHLSSSGI